MSAGEWEDFKQRIGMRPDKEPTRVYPKVADHRFVWLAGPKGPTPQLWHHRNVGVDSANAKPIFDVLRSHDLTPDQAELSLDELAVLFPAPATVPPC